GIRTAASRTFPFVKRSHFCATEPDYIGCEGARVEVDLWSKATEKTESLRRRFVKRSHFCATEPN
ncbi:hypothetical protein QP095_10305, partial [Aerococcus urinae]|uniref:hypothetical protein n=1 Tax=Aerococcus urinae TaxID=1376 RepID=UPI00254A3388